MIARAADRIGTFGSNEFVKKDLIRENLSAQRDYVRNREVPSLTYQNKKFPIKRFLETRNYLTSVYGRLVSGFLFN